MASFLSKKKTFKFQVDLLLVELSDVPLVNANLFAKVRLLEGGKFCDYSKSETVLNHRVTWHRNFRFICKISSDPESAILERCLCRISLRREQKGGTKSQKLGFVDVNLSEFAGSGVAGQTRSYLLEGYSSGRQRQDNSRLSVSVATTLLSADPFFKVPHQGGAVTNSSSSSDASPLANGELGLAVASSSAASDGGATVVETSPAGASPSAGGGGGGADSTSSSQRGSTSSSILAPLSLGDEQMSTADLGSGPSSSSMGAQLSDLAGTPASPRIVVSRRPILAALDPMGGGVGGHSSFPPANQLGVPNGGGGGSRRLSTDQRLLLLAGEHSWPLRKGLSSRIESNRVDPEAVVESIFNNLNLCANSASEGDGGKADLADDSAAGLCLYVSKEDGRPELAGVQSELRYSANFEQVVVGPAPSPTPLTPTADDCR